LLATDGLRRRARIVREFKRPTGILAPEAPGGRRQSTGRSQDSGERRREIGSANF
jgi:hypothetical protein